jgi:GNAT superfamily N-acetyltransferase
MTPFDGPDGADGGPGKAVMQPHRIDVDRARREAKALLASARRGDPTAFARLRDDRPPTLADAQHAVARLHGFRSWRGLLAAADPGRQLRDAARRGDEDGVYALLVAGVDPNAADRSSGRTALHAAAAADQLDTVSVLVGWVPADKQLTDRRGRTALDLARPGSAVAAVLRQFGPAPDRPPLADDHAALAHAAEVALFDHLSRAPGVERWPVGDGFAFRTGRFDNTRNGVVASRAAPQEIAAALDRLADMPASWLLQAVDTGDPGLRAALERAGCQPERGSAIMHVDLGRVDIARDPRVITATDPAQLVGIDRDDAELLLSAGPPLRAFVIAGAASVVTFTVGTTVLGVHMHVARHHRRTGLARALVRHAGAVARDEGCTDAIVSMTDATIPFYERLGLTLERCAPDAWYYLPMPDEQVDAVRAIITAGTPASEVTERQIREYLDTPHAPDGPRPAGHRSEL